MGANLGVWQIADGSPQRLVGSRISIERDLETWIEADPQLVQADLRIVGRQMHTDAGRLDLLGLDVQSRWVVVEIKRGEITRDTIAQALDYAACIRRMPAPVLKERVTQYLADRSEGASDALEGLLRERPETFEDNGEPRDVDIVVVGTGKDDSLDRVSEMLGAQGQLSIRAVLFEVFELASGERVLVRELTDSDQAPAPAETRQTAWSQEALLTRAREAGLCEELTKLIRTADELGLHKRITNKSVMLAPPADRRRFLVLGYADQPLRTQAGMRTIISAEGFREFYGVESVELERLLGPADTWRALQGDELDRFLAGLRQVVTRERNGPP